MTLTAALCDEHGDEVRVLDGGFVSYGGNTSFAGPVTTLSAFEDNSLVREALAEEGGGRVLVVDAGGSTRCAMVGGNLGLLAADNGWAGIIVDGCVRDAAELRGTTLGIRARGTSPRRSVKRGTGQRDVPITVAGMDLVPGMWLWADEDGIVVADRNLEA